jgi:uncharacterized membrane protein
VEALLLFALVVLAVPYVLPILQWVYARNTRSRVEMLESVVEEQRAAIERMNKRLLEIRREIQQPASAPPDDARAPAGRPAEAPAPAAAETTPVAPPHQAIAPPPSRPATPLVVPPAVARTDAPRATAGKLETNPATSEPPPSRADSDALRRATPGLRVPSEPPPPPPRPALRTGEPEPPGPRFDWESLVGVKLFSAIAGIALVLAAIFFLRYSIDHGWLQPPVRVLIGIVVAVALLAVCEMKAARRYPVTANALDAAAIAILFSTFFAAHALWALIPGIVAFGLLAIVTALAVLLSIRRESLFIAVLGLLGGFSTPALLSTGENAPIPLFAYLLLLNVGLAWVAYRQRWPVLTVLTLVLTTIYQWGWVFKFLDESPLPLALGVFIVFPLVTFAGFLVARRGERGEEASFERTALAAAMLPLLFALYLAAVPAYGARASLLFGFLLLVDGGLLAIAIARRQPPLHMVGAVATLLTMGIWLAASYTSDARYLALIFTAIFAVLFMFAPALARRFERPLGDAGTMAVYVAPTILFVFPALAGMEPAFASPAPLFGTLLALVVLCAWRAVNTGHGLLYYVASFFAVAAQAVWSIAHLTQERLGWAVAVYAVFGVVALAVPISARRAGRPLEPAGAGGVLLLASLGLLLFLSSGAIAPSALWALALLLAILNAALFVESASGRLPLVSQAGSILSWIILASWWMRAAATVGLLPSLFVLAGLTLVTLGGHAWAHAFVARHAGSGRADADAGFAGGLYLGLIGHLFLLFVALNREWSVPPWPMFGTLVAITLGTSAASLATRASVLHAAGVVAAALVVAAWTAVGAVMPWTLTGVIASAVITAFALGWQMISRRFGDHHVAAVAAAGVLFLAELTAIIAAGADGRPPFAAILAAHAVNLSIVLALTWRKAWPFVALVAAAIGWLAVLEWQVGRDLRLEWKSLLILAGALYAVFTAYPLIVGRRAAATRDPWLAALIAGAMFFFAARAAFDAGGLGGTIGIVPVVQALITALLLRMLLRIEPPGKRDLARLALVAGSALAFVTVAIPLQLDHQWITIGWALEGAALAWLYRRVPHRGLLFACLGLLTTVFLRLALNPAVFRYEPRGATRILNWYLYTYLVAAVAMLAAAWWLSSTEDRLERLPRASHVLPAGAVVLLFLLLNIEIADYYSTGPEIMFRFGASLSQDLTYTVGWLLFGMLLLAAGIYSHARPARVTAVTMIALTTFKCFLYDLGSLEGLYRVASFVGLAMSLALVSLALQKYVLAKPKGIA